MIFKKKFGKTHEAAKTSSGAQMQSIDVGSLNEVVGGRSVSAPDTILSVDMAAAYTASDVTVSQTTVGSDTGTTEGLDGNSKNAGIEPSVAQSVYSIEPVEKDTSLPGGIKGYLDKLSNKGGK